MSFAHGYRAILAILQLLGQEPGNSLFVGWGNLRSLGLNLPPVVYVRSCLRRVLELSGLHIVGHGLESLGRLLEHVVAALGIFRQFASSSGGGITHALFSGRLR